MRVQVVSVGVVARAWLMAKEFRPVRRDQVFLMPPDMREWLPSDHLVWFILDTLEALDLTGLEATRRRGGVGAAGYDPRMLLGLLMYGYCRGVRSSRQIERLCGTDVAFRVLCAQDVPDHCTLARFRADCQDGFISLFTQVLMIAGRAGLARFGTVAIDGTKIAANASIDANRGQEWLALEVDRMVTDAEQVDAQEDVLSAQGHLPAEGERLPATLTDGKGRRARIRAAAAEVTKILEQQAQADQVRDAAARQRRERAEAGESVIGRIPAGPHRLAEALAHLDREVARQQAKLEHRAAIIAAGKKPMGAPPVPVEEHSSVIRARRAVEAALAAEDANTSPASSRRSQAKKLPRTVANNLASPGPVRLIAISKNRDQLKTARELPVTGPPWAGATPRQAMEHRLRTVEGVALYKRRGATVEPGIGNLKKIIDRFSRRGLDAVASELHLAATAFNLMKIHRSAPTG
jgi:transposase